MIELTLPYPPSVNTYWRSPNKGKLAGRHLISVKGREYRKAVQDAVMEQMEPEEVQERLYVRLLVNVPDRRKRDLDNLTKAIFDAISHAGVWGDDEQIDHYEVIRGDRVPGGSVRVTIVPIDHRHAHSGSIP